MERYALFGVICAGYVGVILWMLFRRRVTLQASLTYLVLMVGLAAGSLLLRIAPGIVTWLGFTLPSNLFFSLAIATLAYLHLNGLVAMSRVEQRCTALAQEVALLQEQLDRLRATSKNNACATTPQLSGSQDQ